MSNTRTSGSGSIAAFIISAVLVVLATWVFLNRQLVLDQLSVWSFQPTEEVITISKSVQFTDKGRFIFYATAPTVESQGSFNKKCPRQEPGSPILGCYTSDDRIYIYDITNENLKGMEEVTAAHEMLHAVWVRTSEADKQKLSKELREEYRKIDNSELKKRMEYYQRTEPGEFANELHSILGTEIEPLSDSLRSYYEQFFDRSTVLALHKQYNTVYKGLYSRADELYSRMETLSVTIQGRSRNYDVAVSQLSADIASFNRRANSNGFATQGQFNAERNALIARTGQLDSQRQAINSDINQYNEYYDEYQNIAKQIEVLDNSIDSFKQIDQAPSV